MIVSVGSSVSALRAASISLAVRADNIANVRTIAQIDQMELDRPSSQRFTDEVFRPRKPFFIARDSGGVDVKAVPVDPSHAAVFDPANAIANDDGFVAFPNLNMEENLMGLLQDRAMFVANLAVVKTGDEMTGALLNDLI